MAGSISVKAQNQSVTEPENQKCYYIQCVGSPHTGKLVGQHDEINTSSDLSIAEATYDVNQQFRFISAGTDSRGHDLFLIQLVADDLYIARSGYNCRLSETGSKFWIEVIEDSANGETVCIRNENSSDGWGLDSGNYGVWTNKSGTGGLREFLLIEVSETALKDYALAALSDAIKEAENALLQPGDYPEDMKLALQAAIEVAYTITDVFSVEDIKSVTLDLSVKKELYLQSQIFPQFKPKQGVEYRIFMSSADLKRLYVGTNDHNTLVAQQHDEANAGDQLWFFELQDEENGRYWIRSSCSVHPEGGRYLDGQTLTLTEEIDENGAWTMTFVQDKQDGEIYFRFVNIAGKYLNFALGGVAGEAVDDDGDGVSNSSIMAIEAVQPDRRNLKVVIDRALNIFESTYEGTGAGEYPKSSREAFEEVINQAQDLFDDDATQAEINEMEENLNLAINTYLDSVNTGGSTSLNDQTSLQEPVITVWGKNVNITNLQETGRIYIYNISGQLILTDSFTGSEYQCTVSTGGNYIISVEQTSSIKRSVVIVN